MSTEERFKIFLERDDGHSVGLVRFLAVKNYDLNRAWIDASRHWIEDVGGERIYAGDLDVVPGRAALIFDQLLIEEYPSRQAAMDVMRRSSTDAAMGLRDHFVIALRPESRAAHRIVALLGRITKTLMPLKIEEVPEFQYRRDIATAGLSSDEAQIAVFQKADQWRPFTMVNINQFSDKARYRGGSPVSGSEQGSGRKAYERYVRNTAIEVFRRGGNFFWIATPITVLRGDSNHPLAKHWSQFVLVCWPSRMALRHMLSSRKFSRGISHRSAGLTNALAIPGTPWPEYDRYSL